MCNCFFKVKERHHRCSVMHFVISTKQPSDVIQASFFPSFLPFQPFTSKELPVQVPEFPRRERAVDWLGTRRFVGKPSRFYTSLCFGRFFHDFPMESIFQAEVPEAIQLLKNPGTWCPSVASVPPREGLCLV